MTFSTTTSSTTLNKPVLREGSTGENVKELQELLLPHGVFSCINYDYACVYPGEEVIDGIFGCHTTNAVKLFQSKVFLSEDGIVGD
ncbi:peptidoglycan-binding domain-containing protein [Mastigocoleus testarum]|uniref:peptidoglycan-binding domain-containing protein n=1 Tax=Mastigocoleus testarum TaxID=996925 RepID=UPI0003FD9CD3|nr:peptidoglycan-binding domain-containing protein [Mastigocoleus testarum]